MGLATTGRSRAPLVDLLEADLEQFINRASEVTLADDDKLEQALKKIVRQTALDEIGKKPEVTVVISRLSA
jgi:ribonuclease J